MRSTLYQIYYVLNHNVFKLDSRFINLENIFEVSKNLQEIDGILEYFKEKEKEHYFKGYNFQEKLNHLIKTKYPLNHEDIKIKLKALKELKECYIDYCHLPF